MVVTAPVAATAHMAEALILQNVLPDPTQAQGRRHRRPFVIARWAAAAVLTVFGAFLVPFLIVIFAAAQTITTWASFGLWALAAAVLLVGHALLTLRTARRGNRLVLSGRDPWVAQNGEAQHQWRVLTRVMPLRAWDIMWLFVALTPVLALFLRSFWQARPSAQGANSGNILASMYVAQLCMVLAVVGVLWLLDRLTPQLTLARWAADSDSRRGANSGPLWLERTGTPAAKLLNVCVRRRARRLPSSLRDSYREDCAKLSEILRVAQLQQRTRPEVVDLSRAALQYSANIACCIDVVEATRQLRAWLVRQGLSSFPAPLPTRRGIDPAVKLVGNLADLLRNLIYIAVALAILVVFLRAGAGFAEFVRQFR
ncbi:hypothetical protein SAMN05660642_01345 [Geodermatophilus siccatus]|uniref:Uncharacterized protein n=1 Tax=Geodermatophilus siccatus TaxID=1137991 RepID=A0A1G9PU26_9ACTN|nr:hypothetical protein SAMN05660642_01345 [Geodermatophilus siccatus]